MAVGCHWSCAARIGKNSNLNQGIRRAEPWRTPAPPHHPAQGWPGRGRQEAGLATYASEHQAHIISTSERKEALRAIRSADKGNGTGNGKASGKVKPDAE